MRSICLQFLMLLFASSAVAAQVRPEGDEWLRRPVDDRTFRTYLSFFAYDRGLSLDVKVNSTENIDGVRVEHLSYESSPGVQVTARLYHAQGGARRPGVVLMHGGGAQGKDSPGLLALAEFLARAGYTTLSFDLQYFGERKTSLLTTFSEEEKHVRLYNQPSTYLSFVTQTVRDAGRGYDLLVERGIDPGRVALLGISRGGQLSLIVGGADNRFATVLAMIAGHFDAFENGHHGAACPANYIGRISPRPLLMVNGSLDADYDRKISVEPLQKHAKDPKRFIWHEAGHTLPTEQTRLAIVQWLNERMN